MPTLSVTVPQPYDFAAAVRDHGWVALAPCGWESDQATLTRVERLSDGQVVLLAIYTTPATPDQVQVTVTPDGALSPALCAEIRAKVRWMLKLDVDLDGFYQRARRHDHIWSVVQTGRGRLLRSPTLFEDVVKTICTTNITWSQTKAMVQRLVDALGDPCPAEPTRRAFPTPEQVAAAGPARFAQEIRMGYRNDYVLQLAREVTAGARDLEALRTADLSLAEMKRELRSIKGVGNYAAHTLLMLLGYYGEVAVDSEYRAFVTQHYFDGVVVPDKELAAIYDEWGDWKYLANWFDATDR